MFYEKPLSNKSRATTGTGLSRRYDRFTKTWSETSPTYLVRAQSVFSRGNPISLLRSGTLQRVGGPFLNRKVTIEWDPTPVALRHKNTSGLLYAGFDSALIPTSQASGLIKETLSGQEEAQIDAWVLARTPEASSDSDLHAAGTIAIDRCAPANPVWDGSTAVAELISEGLPPLRVSKGADPATYAAGEWLTWNFAYLPVIADWRDWQAAMKSSAKTVDQAMRDSGRRVRRRYSYPGKSASSHVQQDGVYPYWLGYNGDANVVRRGRASISTTTSERTWFAGAFKYHFPEQGVERRLAELDASYGVKPGLDTAWNLIPFSWAADYFSSVGAAVDNFAATANSDRIMLYGYLMRTQKVREIHTWTGELKVDDQWQTVSKYAFITKEVQQRVSASPYGFGLSLGDLTPKQVANLVAAGITTQPWT